MLTQENKSNLVSWLDGKIKLKGIPEALDGVALKIGINLLDAQVFDKYIPIDLADDVNEFVADLVQDEFVACADNLAVILSTMIPTPYIDGEKLEEELYALVLEQIAFFLMGLGEDEEE